MLVSASNGKMGTLVPGDAAGASEPPDQFPGFTVWLLGQRVDMLSAASHQQGVNFGLYRVYPGLGRDRESGHSPRSSCVLHQSWEMGNFSLAVLTSHSPFSSVSTRRPSALFWRCPLSKTDQRDSQTPPTRPAPRSSLSSPSPTVLCESGD